MSPEEQHNLQAAILTVCDTRGNWQYGWAEICRLAGLDQTRCAAPFKARTEEDLRDLANVPLQPRRDAPAILPAVSVSTQQTR